MGKPGFKYDPNFGLLEYGEIANLQIALQYHVSKLRSELAEAIGRQTMGWNGGDEFHINSLRSQLDNTTKMKNKVEKIYRNMNKAEIEYQEKVKEHTADSLGVVVNGNIQPIISSNIETINIALQAGFVISSEDREYYKKTLEDPYRDGNAMWFEAMVTQAINWMNEALMPDDYTFIGWFESDLMVQCSGCDEDGNKDNKHSSLCLMDVGKEIEV